MKVSDIKKNVAAKVAKGKAKVSKKCGRARKVVSTACVACMLSAILAGCATSEPASRLTKGGVTHVEISGEGHRVTITLDSSVASSADSKGSTETTHANPTNTTSVPIEVRYNDALKTATDTTKATLAQIGGGLGAVLDMLLNKGTGTVEVTKTDGSKACVTCQDGQCAFGECAPQ